MSTSQTNPTATRTELEALLPEVEKPLGSFLLRLLRNPEQAEDARQDTLLKALIALDKGTGHLPAAEPESIQCWLFAIARHTAIDALRRSHLITWIPLSRFADAYGIGAGLPVQESDGAYSGEQAADIHVASSSLAHSHGAPFEDRVALYALIEQALAELPADYACCLRLFALEGYSCQEIAKRLHISPAAVKMRLYRAHKRLAALYHA